MSELVIDETNFKDYFRDVRMNRPERNEIIARYAATAELIGGQLKKDLIDLLRNRDKALAATQVMRKLGCATEKDSIRVCKEICRDLNSGMTAEEVEQKEYKYTIEVFYYTRKEYVPLDDPHWSIISLDNLDEFLDAADQRITMKTKIIEPEAKEVANDDEVR